MAENITDKEEYPQTAALPEPVHIAILADL